MPCYDGRDSPSYVHAEAKKEFQADLDKLTRLLCEAMPYVMKEITMTKPSTELLDWWIGHQKLDKRR